MRLADLTQRQLIDRLKHGGLCLRTGPFRYRIHSPIASVAEGLALMYPQAPLASEDQFIDFDVTLASGRGWRRWIRPTVRFVYDGEAPFDPLPQDHAYPMLEWAMNWCVSTQAHHYLVLHAAVIERDGLATILPAPPGSGKSTLCAALIHRGWRLMSDELTLISPQDGRITPLARPVSLKNESLEVIRAFEPGVVMNRPVGETFKGTVSHLRPPRQHVERIDETARARWVVFPRFQPGAPATLIERPKADSLVELALNAFNYSLLGRVGFDRLGQVVDDSDCLSFVYSRLDDAVAVFERLHREAS